ncbi:hypothetical protein ADUPG1_001352, partial [Aduncisulcus paluster]
IFSESGVRKKVLPVLKDTKVQPPRGNYVYQLRVPHRSEIMEFCHSVIDLVKSDTNLVLPSIGTLVEDSVLLILKTLTQLEIDETCGDHDYVKSVLEKVVGAYTSGSVFEEFVKEARDVVCECHTVDGHGEPVLDLVADYVCAMEKLTKRSGRDAWNESQTRRAIDLVVDGLRPVEFGDKIREDIRDFRQYGVSGSASSSSSELKYGEDTLVSVFSYTLRLVQDADKSRSIGAALVGRSGDILTKRRYGGSVGDLDDLDRKFK